VGGFERLDLDLKGQTVSVAYEPGPDRPEVYVQVINGLGYEARLLSSSSKVSP
jgi:hypothetical protein